MPQVTRIDSSDVQVFFDDLRITGIQSSSIEASREYQDIRELGNLSNTDKILTSNQSPTVNFDYLAIQNGYDPFDTQNGLLNIDKKEIKIKDLAGETFVSGCYLDSCSLNLSVGQVAAGSVSFVADSLFYNEQNALTFNDQTNDSNVNLFRPQEITISGAPDYSEGIDGCSPDGCSFCIQSASISVNIARQAVNRVGERVPFMRYPTLPINGEVTFETIKTNITGIDLTPIILEKGSLFFDLKNDSNDYFTNYEIKDCSLISISESESVDDNVSVSFSYEFPLNNNSIVVTKS